MFPGSLSAYGQDLAHTGSLVNACATQLNRLKTKTHQEANIPEWTVTSLRRTKQVM